jgi:16S rRNA pseudouridine516 synthase
MVKAGRIAVEGNIVSDFGLDVDPQHQSITLDNVAIFYRESITLMLNKPAGLVSANTDAWHETVLSLIHEPFHRFDLAIAGRLDLDTVGLVLLTNDGELIHRIISPKKDIAKTYRFELDSAIGDLTKLETGITIPDGKSQPFLTKPAKIIMTGTHTGLIMITEGKFHQVKRMFEAIGNQVLFLKREKIGGLELDPLLQPGEYRLLEDAEISLIFQ